MKKVKGRIPAAQPYAHLVAVENIDLFDDGNLYTITLLSEGVNLGTGEILPEARVISTVLQSPPPRHRRTQIPKTVLMAAQRKARRS